MLRPTCLVTVAALALSTGAGCGGSSSVESGRPPALQQDYAASFAGTWNGTLTVSAEGTTQSGSAYTTISVAGVNSLVVGNICDDGSGPGAAVTWPDTFTVQARACPAAPVTGCNAVTFAVSGGTGAVANGTLAMVLDGTVSGCGRSLAVHLVFSGTRGSPAPPVDYGPPTAVIASHGSAVVGAALSLDASGSRDPNALPLTYAWSVVAGPAGATPQLTGTSTPVATFTAAAGGDYSIQVVVTASDGQSATATTTVRAVVAQALSALAHGVASAEYSAALERIIMTDGGPNALYVYDPATGDEASVALPLAPQCLGLSPDGKYAVVGHNAWISHVDLVAAKVLKTIAVAADVGDCVLAGNGFAYLFPRVDQWVALHSVELASGTDTTTSSWAIYAGDRGRLHPDGKALYFVSSYLSPAQIYHWDVSAGPATSVGESPYWGDYAMGSPLWISRDGARIFTASATAFRTSTVRSQDLLYGGALEGMGGLVHLDSSLTEIAAIPRGGGYGSTLDDTTVELFGNDYLAHQGTLSLPFWQVGANAYPTHGRFVFYSADGSRKFVVVRAEPSSGLLHDIAVLTY